VGRGALAGPVTVGAVAVDLRTRACPKGVADSKLLSPAARQRLVPALSRWGTARAVGHAGPDEIDAIGIVAALRLAGRRALAQLGVVPDVVLLDGSHDWLSAPRQPGLFELAGPEADAPLAELAGHPELDGLAVRTRVKADRTCASVAAASVLAKCARDALMVDLAAAHPEYGWAENKGYGAPEHLEALRSLGPTPLHRRSWRLPLAGEPVPDPLAEQDAAVPDTLSEQGAAVPDTPAEQGAPATGPTAGTEDAAAEPGRWAMMDS